MPSDLRIPGCLRPIYRRIKNRENGICLKTGVRIRVSCGICKQIRHYNLHTGITRVATVVACELCRHFYQKSRRKPEICECISDIKGSCYHSNEFHSNKCRGCWMLRLLDSCPHSAEVYEGLSKSLSVDLLPLIRGAPPLSEDLSIGFQGLLGLELLQGSTWIDVPPLPEEKNHPELESGDCISYFTDENLANDYINMSKLNEVVEDLRSNVVDHKQSIDFDKKISSFEAKSISETSSSFAKTDALEEDKENILNKDKTVISVSLENKFDLSNESDLENKVILSNEEILINGKKESEIRNVDEYKDETTFNEEVPVKPQSEINTDCVPGEVVTSNISRVVENCISMDKYLENNGVNNELPESLLTSGGDVEVDSETELNFDDDDDEEFVDDPDQIPCQTMSKPNRNKMSAARELERLKLNCKSYSPIKSRRKARVNYNSTCNENTSVSTSLKKPRGKPLSFYGPDGRIRETGLDLCDCLSRECRGCHFPCPKCRSPRCGNECRVNRRWYYEKVIVEGTKICRENLFMKP